MKDEYVVGAPEAEQAFGYLGSRIAFFGIRTCRAASFWNQSRVETILRVPGYRRSFTLDIDPECAYLINPGSVGQPRDGDPRAAYAVYDSERAGDVLSRGVRRRGGAEEDSRRGAAVDFGGSVVGGKVERGRNYRTLREAPSYFVEELNRNVTRRFRSASGRAKVRNMLAIFR